MTPHRHRVAVAASILVAVAVPRAARAQHCHIDTPPPASHAAADRVAVTIVTRWVAGSAEVPEITTPMTVARGYQGVDLGVDVGWRRWTASARLGAYRVDDHGVGPDDLRLAGAVAVTPARSPVTVRALVGATMPTGDADAGRGMGHVMVVGGAVASGRVGRLTGDLTVAYARALGSGAEHAAHIHGTDAWPLIDPMGAEEVTAEAGAAVAIGPRGLALRGGALVAEPVAMGERRLVVSGGAAFARGHYRIGAMVLAPAIGDVYTARGELELAYRY